MRQELLLKRINTCSEGKERDVPVDRHLGHVFKMHALFIVLISISRTDA